MQRILFFFISLSVSLISHIPLSQAEASDSFVRPKPKIEVQGRQLRVDGEAFILKGVCYNPVAKGKSHPEGSLTHTPSASDLRQIEEDFRMMKEAGINTIRTYSVIRDKKVLALLDAYELFVIVPVLNSTTRSLTAVAEDIKALKNEPSTLMWQVGNEWNYNKLYNKSWSYEEAKSHVMAVGARIKALDQSHPLSTNYGEMPGQDLIEELTDFDVWSLNIYAGKSFGSRFERWKQLSGKPVYIGEFGADAINVDHLDLESQRLATAELIEEIKAELSAKSPDNALVGGAIFSWVDGWWKDPKGSLHEQDVGGNAPGGGPYPDGIFNEEFWGIVDIERRIRPAYTALKNAWLDPRL